jgi:exodeoxyribonuclease VIII
MTDLETMGLRPNSAIVSIGVVEFNETEIGAKFYCNVSLEDCLRLGLVKDPSTEQWWALQSSDARDAWSADCEPLESALTKLNRFFESCGCRSNQIKLWGNGAGYDNVLLKSAYLALNADEPWQYYNNRCFRTMKAMFPLESPPARVGTYHNALDDAMTQVLTLQAICGRYGIQLS